MTCEWLNSDIFVDILQKNSKDFVKINNFEIKPAVATGENFLTNVVNVRIEIVLKDGTKEEQSFLVKTMHELEIMKNLVKESKIFDKERIIYEKYLTAFQNLFKNVGKDVCFGPKMFKTNKPNVACELIILEDLRVRGFQNVKRQEGFDMSHTKCVLEKLAQFHAASACYFEENGPYPEIYNRCLNNEHDEFSDYRLKVAERLIKCLPLYDCEHLAEQLLKYAEASPDQFQAKSKLYADEFHVLNHGDCWSNNIMFKHNADGSIAETYFIDFQMSRYGSPAHDLTYVLLGSTSLETKIKYFDYYVSYYHEKLEENLRVLKYPKNIPTLKEIHVSLFRHGDWAYSVSTNIMPIILLDPNENASIENVVGDGEDSKNLQEAMFTNPRFVAHMRKLLPWMANRSLLTYCN